MSNLPGQVVGSWHVGEFHVRLAFLSRLPCAHEPWRARHGLYEIRVYRRGRPYEPLLLERPKTTSTLASERYRVVREAAIRAQSG